jgi:hypothetical protein
MKNQWLVLTVLFFLMGLSEPSLSHPALTPHTTTGNCEPSQEAEFNEAFPQGNFVMDCYRYCFVFRASNSQKCLINLDEPGTTSVYRLLARNLAILLALIDSRTEGGVYWSDNALTSSTTLLDLQTQVLSRGQSDLCQRLDGINRSGLSSDELERLNSARGMFFCPNDEPSHAPSAPRAVDI